MERLVRRETKGPQLKELIATLEQCKRLGPTDDLVRQYDEWIWRRYRPRRAALPAFTPRIDRIPGAPEWAVVARQAWRTARDVPVERYAALKEFHRRLSEWATSYIILERMN